MRNLLEQAVVALAQSADVQLSLFPDFVCKADELALNFEDGLYEIVGHEAELTTEQHEAVRHINALLASMSGKRNLALWTNDALRSHPVWENVRLAARTASIAFGWDNRGPFRTGAFYVCGRATRAQPL